MGNPHKYWQFFACILLACCTLFLSSEANASNHTIKSTDYSRFKTEKRSWNEVRSGTYKSDGYCSRLSEISGNGRVVVTSSDLRTHDSGEIRVWKNSHNCPPPSSLLKKFLQSLRANASQPEVMKTLQFYGQQTGAGKSHSCRHVSNPFLTENLGELIPNNWVHISVTGELRIKMPDGAFCPAHDSIVEHWYQGWKRYPKLDEMVTQFPQLGQFMAFHQFRGDATGSAPQTKKVEPVGPGPTQVRDPLNPNQYITRPYLVDKSWQPNKVYSHHLNKNLYFRYDKNQNKYYPIVRHPFRRHWIRGDTISASTKFKHNSGYWVKYNGISRDPKHKVWVSTGKKWIAGDDVVPFQGSQPTCWAHAASCLLKDRGRPALISKLIASNPTGIVPIPSWRLRNLLQKFGLRPKSSRVPRSAEETKQWLDNLGSGFIAFVTRHFFYVQRYRYNDDGSLSFLVSDSGRRGPDGNGLNTWMSYDQIRRRGWFETIWAT